MTPRLLPFVLLGLLTSSALTAGEKEDQLVGTWVWKAGKGDDQFWAISRQGEAWAVQGWYEKEGKQTGTFVGSDVRYADGVLTFTHKYVKQPATPGADNVPAKITSGGRDTLSYTWGKDYVKGPRALARATGPKPADPKVESTPKASARKSDRFVGSWKGSIDGYDQVWTVKNDDGVWSVRGAYKKNGAEVGSFAGVEVTTTDTALSFKRKYVKKPVTTWADEVEVVVKVDGVNLVYTSGSAPITKLLEPFKEEEPAAVGKELPKDVAKFQGLWEGEVEQFRTLWDVRQKDGKWEVAVEYFSKNPKTGALTPVGGFVGTDTGIKDGHLVFETKFIKKPTPGWSGGKITCKLHGENSFEYVLETGGVKKKPLPVSRLKK